MSCDKQTSQKEPLRFLRRARRLPEKVRRERVHAFLDACEKLMVEQGEEVQCPIRHRFTPGLYIREMTVKAGTLFTSKLHKSEHPFVISKGVVSVWTEAEGKVMLKAPHTGITKPGTRRMVYVHEDTVWTTFHPTELTDVDAIEAAIIEKRERPQAAEKLSTKEKECLS